MGLYSEGGSGRTRCVALITSELGRLFLGCVGVLFEPSRVVGEIG